MEQLSSRKTVMELEILEEDLFDSVPVEEYPYRYIKVNTIEERWIERSRSNVADFITYLTDGENIPADHHLDWLEAIFGNNSARVNIIAFPGSGKTSIVNYSFAWLIGLMPWLTNLICSASTDQAKGRLSAVREMITLNQRYFNVFPWIEIDNKRPNNSTQLNVWSRLWKNSKVEIDYSSYRSLIARYGQPKDHTLLAAGITSKVINGVRISGLGAVDDAHDIENSATPQARKKVIDFFRKIFLTRFTPTPYARGAVIGTRWAVDDLSGTLAEEKRLDGTPVWATIITPIEDGEEKPTWPEVWDKDKVAERAEEVGGKDGPEWQLSYLNNAIGLASGEFTPDMLRIDLPEELPDFREVFISCDFAHTEAMASDWTVYAAVARDHEKNFGYYILDIERFKKSQISDKTDNLAKFSDQIYENFGRLDGILFEDKDSQAEVQSLGEKRPDLPIKVVKTKGDKGTRLNAVGNKAQQQKKFFINQKMKYRSALVSELLGFPKAKHDDTCDAVSLPFQLPEWSTLSLRAGTVRIKSRHAI